MAMRKTSSTVTFMHPFSIGDSVEVQQAGTYDVETIEELAEGWSFKARKTVSTHIHLPDGSDGSGFAHILVTVPYALDNAIARDMALSANLSHQKPTFNRVPSRLPAGQKEVDMLAESRAENEGMALLRQ